MHSGRRPPLTAGETTLPPGLAGRSDVVRRRPEEPLRSNAAGGPDLTAPVNAGPDAEWTRTLHLPLSGLTAQEAAFPEAAGDGPATGMVGAAAVE